MKRERERELGPRRISQLRRDTRTAAERYLQLSLGGRSFSADAASSHDLSFSVCVVSVLVLYYFTTTTAHAHKARGVL